MIKKTKRKVNVKKNLSNKDLTECDNSAVCLILIKIKRKEVIKTLKKERGVIHKQF